MTLVIKEKDFTHILRIENTNVDGRKKLAYALTSIKGIGVRMATLACKKAGLDPHRRAGEYKVREVEKVINVIRKPQDFNIPVWFLNRRKDIDDGTNYQLISNSLDSKLREDIERMKKMRAHRGLRHHWGIKVRGQHTKTTGRKGNKAVGTTKKGDGKK